MSSYYLNSVFIMFSFLQIETPIIPDQLWQVDPFNGLAYGALIVCLVAINYLTYKTWKDAEASAKEKDGKMLEFNSKIVELMIKIEIKLNDTKELHSKFDELLSDTKQLYEDIKQLKSEVINIIHGTPINKRPIRKA